MPLIHQLADERISAIGVTSTFRSRPLPETIVATATTMENTMMTGPIQPITSSSLLNPNAKATKISTAISRLPT